MPFRFESDKHVRAGVKNEQMKKSRLKDEGGSLQRLGSRAAPVCGLSPHGCQCVGGLHMHTLQAQPYFPQTLNLLVTVSSTGQTG